MPHQIPAEFSGPGSGIGELTRAQRGIRRVSTAQGASEFIGGTVDAVAAALRYAMSRHQSLHTRLVFDGRVRIRWCGRDFAYADEWLGRMAVVCAHGVPVARVPA
jgi:hypothetical protein